MQQRIILRAEGVGGWRGNQAPIPRGWHDPNDCRRIAAGRWGDNEARDSCRSSAYFCRNGGRKTSVTANPNPAMKTGRRQAKTFVKTAQTVQHYNSLDCIISKAQGIAW